MSDGTTRPRSEAEDATRGSAIKLTAEVLSRLVGLGTTLLLAWSLGVSGFGAFGGRLSVIAVLLAELAELGLQATASRALVANTVSLRSLARARAVAGSLVAGAALLALPLAPVLSPLVLFYVLAGWAEFLGVALRCRRARVQEAFVLLVLRAGSLAFAAVAIAAGSDLPGLAWSQALSPLPALALGGFFLRRHPAAAPAAPEAPLLEVARLTLPLAVHSGLVLLSLNVEVLLLSVLAGDRETGLFLSALRVLQFLNVVPTAVAAGAMPALTREALRGSGPVRHRTAGTMALLAAPAAVGLGLVAPALVRRLFPPDYAGSAALLRLLAVALVPLFMNAVLLAALIAVGRAALLPRLMAARVGAAALLALLLVPRVGAVGAALGFLLAETLLLLLAVRACRRAGFPLPQMRPLGVAAIATVPMALAVQGVADSLPLALGIGALTYAATLAAGSRLRPRLLRDVLGDLRYP